MSDLISREAAMNIFAVDLAEKDRQVSYHGFCIDAVMAIDSLPPAEKHGKWIDVENNIDYCPFMCSECYETVIKKTNYCPRCGARMVDVAN